MRIKGIVIYDDLCSYLHTLLGIISVILGLEVAIPSGLAFVIYQLRERERWVRKKGDYVEYVIGLIIGGIVKRILGL